MSQKHQRDREWTEAQRRCGLSTDAVRMAKELGFKPKSLIKNIPSPRDRWKLPVEPWVRELYAKHQRKIAQRRARKERDQAREQSSTAAAPPPPPASVADNLDDVPF